MANAIEFTSNYNDLSTQHGFQFEFKCERCENGFRTNFKPFALGSVDSVVSTASSILGGIFGSASNVTNQMAEAQRERAKEAALLEAINELKPHFIQCPRCQAWVCRKNCWNQKRGLCKNCAPSLEVEVAAAQSSKGVEHAWAQAVVAEEEEKQIAASPRETKVACCPQCGAALGSTTAKFCPECGAKINVVKHCTECGSKLEPGAKFCGECGHKAG
jgi:hypothetical protein